MTLDRLWLMIHDSSQIYLVRFWNGFNCKANNTKCHASNLSMITRVWCMKFETVLLFGFWSQFEIGRMNETIDSMHKTGRVNQIFIIFRVIYWHKIYMRPMELSSNKSNNEKMAPISIHYYNEMNYILERQSQLNENQSIEIILESKAPERHQKSTIELEQAFIISEFFEMKNESNFI